MSQPPGFYRDEEGKIRPITPRASRRGYNSTHKVTYKHHSKYIRSPGETFSAPNQVLPGRQMWLLTQMCKRVGVDPKFIDSSLDYYENKEEIERVHDTQLHLVGGKVGDPGEGGGALIRGEKRRGDEDFEDYIRSASSNQGEGGKSKRERAEEPEHRKAPSRLDGVEWELDHLQGVALTRAEKAEGNSKNFENYYDPYDRAYQQELLAARKRLMGARKEHPKAETPSSKAGVSRGVAVEWKQRGSKAAEEYNDIIRRNNREHRRPTEEEVLQLNRLKETVTHANRALRIHETQPKGPRPRAPRGFKEEATLMDVATGAVVASSRGERNSAKIVVPKTGLFKMSHTHPSDAPHSVKDVHILISNDRLREMEVVTPNRVYTLRKTDETPSAYLATRVYGKTPAALSRGSNAKFTSSTEFSSQEDLIRGMASELHLDFEVS